MFYTREVPFSLWRLTDPNTIMIVSDTKHIHNKNYNLAGDIELFLRQTRKGISVDLLLLKVQSSHDIDAG